MSALRKIRRHSGKRRRRQPSRARQTSDGAAGPGSPERIDLDRSELEGILEHAKTALSEAEYDKLHAAMETLIYLTQELEKNRVSVRRLKQLLFGASTEKTQKVMEKIWYPDFRLPEYGTIIEYFGMNGNGPYNNQMAHKMKAYKDGDCSIIPDIVTISFSMFKRPYQFVRYG